jgi:hypothetical protein
MILLGILTPTALLAIIALYVAITIIALVLSLKKETGWLSLFWTLFILFVPLVGSIVYLMKFFLNRQPLAQ